MAKLTNEQITASIQPFLEPGEQVLHTAYGIQQLSLPVMILLLVLALIPGAITMALLQKNFFVVLTNRRGLIIRYTGKYKLREIIEYRPGGVPPITVSQGAIFAVMRVADPLGAMKIKFHRAGMVNNRENAVAIANALAARPA